MSQSSSHLSQPTGSRWDIDFTRLSAVVRHRVSLCMVQLSLLVRKAGLGAQPSFRIHAAGLSGTLSIVGRRGALASFEFNLVDGLVDARVCGAALDVNLLDAEGGVVTFCSPMRAPGANGHRLQADAILSTAGVSLDANALYALLVQQFDLALERPRAAWPR